MRPSIHIVTLLAVALSGIAVAGQDQQEVPSSQAGQRGSSGGQPRTDAEAVNLIGQKSELTRRAQVLELDLAGIDGRRKALQEQIALLRSDADKRLGGRGQLEEFTRELRHLAIDKAEKEAQLQTIRRQRDEVQKQLAQVAPVTPRTDAEAVNLGGQKSELARRAQVLEMDLAGIDARRKALQEQVALMRNDTGQQSAGDGQLEEFTKELSRLAVDKAGKEAQLQTVRRQLEEVREQLTQVAPSGPRTDAEAVNLGGQKSELTRRAQVLEVDLAGLDARRKALQEQVALIRGEAGRELADTGQVEEFTRELSRLTVDRAGKDAQLQTVRRQRDEVQKQLAQALASDR
jgi:chromosome segregation ATPase